MGGQSLILLDTHCVLWLDQADQRMGRQARSRAEAAIRTGDLAISAISFWEVAMLADKGRLKMGRSLRLWRRDWLQQGMIELPLSGAIGIEAAALADFHANPADPWLVATAREVGATLLTADERILAWPGRLDRYDARV